MALAPKNTGLVTRWWWVRHAPVPNPEGRCYGQFDKDCDVSNEALFKHQAKLLPKGAVWYSSNLLRARKTAEHLGRAGAEFGEVVIDPDLAEQSFGEWQGLTYAEISEKPGNGHLFWLAPPDFRPPGGESFTDLRERTVRSIERLTDKYRGRDIVATAHGGTIRAALAHAFNMHPEAAVRFEIDNVSVTLIEHFEFADPAHAWKVAFTNYMPREIVHRRITAEAARHEDQGRAGGRPGRLLERPGRQDVAGRLRPHPAAASQGFGEVALEAANAQPGERVLDIGCGTGGTTAELAKAVGAGRPGAGRRHLRAAGRGGAARRGSATRASRSATPPPSRSRRSRSISSSRASA